MLCVKKIKIKIVDNKKYVKLIYYEIELLKLVYECEFLKLNWSSTQNENCNWTERITNKRE